MVRLWKAGQLGSLIACAALGFVVGVLGIGVTHAKLLAQGAPAPAAAAAAPAARVFGSDAGLVLNFVKPDKTAEFEAIVGKLREALQKSDKPERKQQAATWRIYRAVEPGANGAILYVFDIHPAVHGADYTVSTILAEGFPNDVQDLYKRYADAYASGQNVVNLTLVAALGQ